MDSFHEIDSRLNELNKELDLLIDSLDFDFVCEFNLENGDKIPWNRLECSGIYFIQIRNDNKSNSFPDWIESFRLKWEDPRFKYRFVPNLKKLRIKRHSELYEWIPLYIGKSKKISSRIYEHIYKPIEQNTFALKLKARDNIQGESFRLSFLPINSLNYDWVMPKIEKTLREKYNPIIGKQ